MKRQSIVLKFVISSPTNDALELSSRDKRSPWSLNNFQPSLQYSVYQFQDVINTKLKICCRKRLRRFMCPRAESWINLVSIKKALPRTSDWVYKTWTQVKIADCGLNAAYRLRTGYKTQTNVQNADFPVK